MGVKGEPGINRGIDCDVLVAEVGDPNILDPAGCMRSLPSMR